MTLVDRLDALADRPDLMDQPPGAVLYASQKDGVRLPGLPTGKHGSTRRMAVPNPHEG